MQNEANPNPPQVAAPEGKELSALADATILFYNQTMIAAFGAAFLEQVPVDFRDRAAPGLGWVTTLIADERFSQVPLPDDVVAVIEKADYATFVGQQVSQVGPYFSQTKELQLVVGAVLKEDPTTALPIVAPATPAPSTLAPAPTTDVATPVPTTAPPTRKPTAAPTRKPTASPTRKPTVAPTMEPTDFPTASPSDNPTYIGPPTFTPRNRDLEEGGEDAW
jgi:PT repeat